MLKLIGAVAKSTGRVNFSARMKSFSVSAWNSVKAFSATNKGKAIIASGATGLLALTMWLKFRDNNSDIEDTSASLSSNPSVSEVSNVLSSEYDKAVQAAISAMRKLQYARTSSNDSEAQIEFITLFSALRTVCRQQKSTETSSLIAYLITQTRSEIVFGYSNTLSDKPELTLYENLQKAKIMKEILYNQILSDSIDSLALGTDIQAVA